MKRYGYIIEEIVTEDNMNESFDYVMRGTRRKTSKSGRYMLAHREEVIRDLQRRISDGSYRVSGYMTYNIKEAGKIREIQSIPLTDRVALNAIMRVVEKYLNRRFIADSAASIKGRGTHYLHKRMLHDMKRDKEGTRFVYKCDVRKFYQSVDQETMKQVLRRVFKDKRLIDILDSCVTMLPQGISIGLRSSQALGNLLLDFYLDHKMKDVLGVRYYRRYCDDIVVQAESYKALTRLKEVIHSAAEVAKLDIKANEQMFDVHNRPIDFLGFQSYGSGNIRVRKHIKHRFAERWKRVKSEQRRVALVGAFYGLVKHAAARHLFKTITGINMKDFSEFGLQYTAPDGKKRFDCKSIPLGELQNRLIVVEDYETGVKTKEGEGRYVVKFSSEELGDGKFITNSDEMKQMLDKIDDMDGIPFRTTIKRKTFGTGKVKYIFT